MPARGNTSKMQKKKRTPFSKRKVVTLYVAITKHIEQSCTSRMKQPSPCFTKNVDVMRHTITSIENASVHTTMIGMMREKYCSRSNGLGRLVSKSRGLSPEGYTCVNDQIRLGWRNGPDHRRNKNEWSEAKTRLQEASRTRGIFDVSPEDTEYLKVISEARAELKKDVVSPMPCLSKRNDPGNPTLCQYSYTL